MKSKQKMFLVFVLVLVYSPTSASAFIGGSIAPDTMFYEPGEAVQFDTIPYMVRAPYFFTAAEELMRMVNGKEDCSLKRAEFLVEWAYLDGKPDYNTFCHDIDSVAQTLRRFININHIGQYHTAPNFALLEYFTKPSPLNGDKAITYDFEDFAGDKDFSKTFVTKVMRTHSGQCTSLPLYYKILCDELGGQSALALAPNHMYVKHIGDDGRWVNIELTNGHFARDVWYMENMQISTEAVRNGVFLCALSDKETTALMLVQLINAYEQKFGQFDYFALRYADSVLAAMPDFAPALVIKFNVHQAFGFACNDLHINPKSDFYRWNTRSFQNTMHHLDSLGYTNVPQEVYMQTINEGRRIAEESIQ